MEFLALSGHFQKTAAHSSADGEVIVLHRRTRCEFLYPHLGAGFCFQTQMIQSTFFGSPPNSLSRVMHCPR